jgi:hypothetical protein
MGASKLRGKSHEPTVYGDAAVYWIRNSLSQSIRRNDHSGVPMNKSLHLAFLATAMAATSTLAAAKPVPAPTPAPVPSLGIDAGSWGFSGTGDATFSVTLSKAGTYTITGNLETSSTSATNFNVSGVTVTGGSVSDSFVHSGSGYSGDPYVFTITAPGELLLAIATNDKKNGAYTGTLTVAEAPMASVVPEPATAALLLAGVGMLGISARRRRNV